MEALNHIAVARPPRLIIVLNDNGRSYAPTVGGIAALATLAHYRFDPRYERTKRTLGKMLRGIPLVGETADELAGRLKDAIKQILEPSTVFDALDLKYTGRIDGHDIALLEETFEVAKSFDRPVVVHVVTEKGSGYQPAIEDELEKLHGVPSFDVATGKALKSELKLTEVAGKAIAAAADTRPDLIGISAAMVSTAGLLEMAQRHPDRVYDTAIAEQHAVTLAAGVAMAGKKPVVAMYSAFLQRAIDQIVADVALHDLPVVFLVDRAGITGPDGPSHHGVFDLSYLRMIPNMVVGAPADATELCAMIETAVDHDGPIAIRYPKGAAVSVPSIPVAPIPIGEAQLLSPGSQVLLVAVGRMVEVAEKAAVDLQGRGHLHRGGQCPLGEAARSQDHRVGEPGVARGDARGQCVVRWLRLRGDGGVLGGRRRQGDHGDRGPRSVPSLRLSVRPSRSGGDGRGGRGRPSAGSAPLGRYGDPPLVPAEEQAEAQGEHHVQHREHEIRLAIAKARRRSRGGPSGSTPEPRARSPVRCPSSVRSGRFRGQGACCAPPGEARSCG